MVPYQSRQQQGNLPGESDQRMPKYEADKDDCKIWHTLYYTVKYLIVRTGNCSQYCFFVVLLEI
jgi:hypothetical protein